MKQPNFFAENDFERTTEKRADAKWFKRTFMSPGAVFLPIWRKHNFIDQKTASPKAAYLTRQELPEFQYQEENIVFLGFRNQVPYFSIDLSYLENPEDNHLLAKKGKFLDIRKVGLQLPRNDGGALAYARALVHWHQTNQYCGRCGSKTETQSSGHVRKCKNSSCSAEHFPRTDSAVIMVVSRGEKICLARKPGWSPEQYSILAGFLEPGETPENAVVREVKEEVGLKVDNVRYHSSQPWPFPTNLMLGYFSEAQSDKITIDNCEIEHARWFSREELTPEALLYQKKPQSVSIARRMIADWVLGNF
ncbi:MAG: NAD(+) diphosphatase [Rhodospirillaceae bacterium]|nr:NAD(+) diphosphatase [Rhodospirillaceae bacterium]|tara:strand:- start:18115 stop:19032 length:918 start_codon:yes stop_codon:yes gene_type:complete